MPRESGMLSLITLRYSQVLHIPNVPCVRDLEKFSVLHALLDNGTMYRQYANVIRSLLTTWCISKSKIPDTQFGFYPGRNTLQPMFILRHLQHAARTIKPSNSSRLHTAFIDLKQAYDTIPRQALWSHLRRIRMPASLLSAL